MMGILNVTPDSFAEPFSKLDPDLAVEAGLRLEREGADLIDVGGESTRPGAEPVSVDEELSRLMPVINRLAERLTVPISVDTYKAEVAERAIELGAEIINDPSGLTFDPQLTKTVMNHNVGVILNHMRGTPDTWAKRFSRRVKSASEFAVSMPLAKRTDTSLSCQNVVVAVAFPKLPLLLFRSGRTSCNCALRRVLLVAMVAPCGKSFN